MSTTVLAYLILFMGFITFLGGAFGVLMLFFEELGKTGRVPFTYYAMAVGLIRVDIRRPQMKNADAPAVKREAGEEL